MILDAFSLRGKVAIVTGCDTGLGQGMSLGLAEAGCDIIGINRKYPHDTEQQVIALGRRFTAIQADLSQQASYDALVQEAVSRMGRIDILVNNAGTIRRADALEFSEQDWDDVINLNLKATFFLCQAVARPQAIWRPTIPSSYARMRSAMTRSLTAFPPRAGGRLTI
ncbi:MAG: kduD 2 [Enterobacter kobei]|nr:kduD 2 [Enterobacter kobei]